MNRITVYAEPTHPEAPDGETLVTINYYARDDKSGLGLVGYILRDPQGIAHTNFHYHRNFYTQYFDGDPTVWEKYTINCILPQGSAPGIWGLAELSVLDKVQNSRGYNFVETLIFEPDNSTTDYVLFSELENNIISLEIASETDSHFCFTYRIINEETGEEISGEITGGQSQQSSSISRAPRSVNSQVTSVDVSSLPDGKLIIIVQIKNSEGEIIGVRSGSLIKKTPTEISVVKNDDLQIYPNPVKDKLIINSKQLTIQEVKIVDVSGLTVYHSSFLVDHSIDVSALPSGVYLVKIVCDGKTYIQKIVNPHCVSTAANRLIFSSHTFRRSLRVPHKFSSFARHCIYL
ncbi:hypothetical protein FACS189413_18710 [Bacteroidia bacterium]|nr:hypothetical protein FACS189413_18710 [Bacteroidia bacterium]